MSSIEITRPAAPLDLCVTVAEVKANAGGIEDTSEDGLIGLMIRAAQSYVEAKADTILNPSTVIERFTGFPNGPLKLGREPVRSVSSLLYIDVEGVETALASEKRQDWLSHNPPLISPIGTEYWPETKTGQMGPVKVTYLAGPTLAVDARYEFKLAVVMIATATFENRDGFLRAGELKIPDAVKQLVEAGAARLPVTTWYVGVTSGIWATGTASAAVPPAGTSQATLIEALAAAVDGDLIRLAPGTHVLPTTIEKDVHLIGYGSAVTTIQTASPVSVVADETTLRAEAVNLTGDLPLRVEGKLSLYRCNAEWDAAAEIATGGAGIAVWCGKPVAALSDAAIGNYPLAAKTNPGGRSGSKISSYRHAVELQAAAKALKASGQKKPETWLTFADLRVRFDERTAREGLQNRLIVANATGLAYCRGGMPVHPDFRMVHGARVLNVQGVNMAVAPRNELEILYSERVG